jgi:hypothetical protein
MFVMTDDGRLLGPPRTSDAADKGGVKLETLRPVAEAGFPGIAAAMATWQADHGDKPDRSRVALGGETWWTGFTPFEISSQCRLWIGMLLPESALVPWARYVQALIAGIGALALAAAALMAVGVARRFSEPWQNWPCTAGGLPRLI